MNDPPKLDYFIHYKKWHNHNDENHRLEFAAYITKMLHPVLPEDKQAHILEIGCSNGLGLLGLRSLGYTSLKGVDSSPEMISIAKTFSLDVVLADAMDYLRNFEKNHYSLIYMVDTLEHICTDNIPGLLWLVFEALAPNGRLFLQVPNADSPIGMHFRYIDWTHCCSFTTYSIFHLLENAGFREINISESFGPEEPRVDDYEQDANGRKDYEEELKRYRGKRLARKLTRWHVAQFGENFWGMPLTPNIDIVAKKTHSPMTCQVNVDFDNESIDPLVLTDQIDENKIRIQSLVDWNNYIEDKNNSLEDRVKAIEKNHEIQLAELQESYHKKNERLIDWNNWLEAELERVIDWNNWLEAELELLKKRNIFITVIKDTLKSIVFLIRWPFEMGRAIRYLPASYENMINKKYYNESNEQ